MGSAEQSGSTTRDDFSILLRALSELQNVHLAADNGTSLLRLPTIVAIGNQSDGKSSTIERLIGLSLLPCGIDMVTKCPVKIRVHRVHQASGNTIRFHKEEKYRLEAVELTDLKKVKEEIKKRTELRVGGKSAISHEEILVDLFTPHYPDLQIVDLPGFTKTSVGDQPRDIEEQIQQLVLKYLKSPDIVILAINDSNQDIGTYESLKHAEREDVDPQGERTICVLTKLDKLRAGEEVSRAVAYLANQRKMLRLGYYGLVNLPPRADEEEARLLGSMPAFERVRGRIGIQHLRQHLIRILAERIQKILPTHRRACEARITEISAELERLGVAQVEENEASVAKRVLKLSVPLVKRVERAVSTQLEGYSRGVSTLAEGLGLRLSRHIKEGALAASAAGRASYPLGVFTSELEMAARNMHGASDHMMPVELVLNVGVNKLVQGFRAPFVSLVQSSVTLLKRGLESLVESSMPGYPRLIDLVVDILFKQLEENSRLLETHLTLLIDTNQEVVNTDHEDCTRVNKLLNRLQPRRERLWFQEGIARPDPNQKNKNSKDDISTATTPELSRPPSAQSLRESVSAQSRRESGSAQPTWDLGPDSRAAGDQYCDRPRRPRCRSDAAEPAENSFSPVREATEELEYEVVGRAEDVAEQKRPGFNYGQLLEKGAIKHLASTKLKASRSFLDSRPDRDGRKGGSKPVSSKGNHNSLDQAVGREDDLSEDVCNDNFQETLFLLDCCLEYVEIIDKQLLDQIPKLLIMQLVNRTIEFIHGDGNRDSLMKQVIQQISAGTEEQQEQLMTADSSCVDRIRCLRDELEACQNTLQVIEKTYRELAH